MYPSLKSKSFFNGEGWDSMSEVMPLPPACCPTLKHTGDMVVLGSVQTLLLVYSIKIDKPWVDALFKASTFSMDWNGHVRSICISELRQRILLLWHLRWLEVSDGSEIFYSICTEAKLAGSTRDASSMIINKNKLHVLYKNLLNFKLCQSEVT